MSFLREKRARFYFLFLSGIALVLLLFSILMTWQHTRQAQELLLEKEASLASSLLEQGVSAEVVAEAMKSESISTNGLTFIVPILFCLPDVCAVCSLAQTARLKIFSKNLHNRQDKSPVFVMVIKKGIFPSMFFDN